MIVELRRNVRHKHLAPKHRYVVIGIEADDLRILNDEGRPYLYPRRLFRVIDRARPADWIVERGEDGETYAYPPALGAPGFFEDFFDGKKKAVATFWHAMNGLLGTAVSTPNLASGARQHQRP